MKKELDDDPSLDHVFLRGVLDGFFLVLSTCSVAGPVPVNAMPLAVARQPPRSIQSSSLAGRHGVAGLPKELPISRQQLVGMLVENAFQTAVLHVAVMREHDGL